MLPIDGIKADGCIEVKEELIDEESDRLYGWNDEYFIATTSGSINNTNNNNEDNSFIKEEEDDIASEHITMGTRTDHEKLLSHSCMYCLYTFDQEKMIQVHLNQLRLQLWNDVLGCELDYQKSDWICKSHFKPVDFTETGALHERAAPYQTDKSNIFFIPKPIISYKTCLFCRSSELQLVMVNVFMDAEELKHWTNRDDLTTENNKDLWACKSHFKSHHFTSSGALKYNAALSLKTPSPDEVMWLKTCLFCQSKTPFSDMTQVFADSEKLEYWKLSNDITSSTSRFNYVCKSHFKSTDFTSNGLLKYNEVLSLGKPSLIETTCVYCHLKKLPSEFARIEMSETRFEFWKNTIGYEFEYADVLENPLICKSHFDPNDIMMSGKLKPSSYPIEDLPMLKCFYCGEKSTFRDLTKFEIEKGRPKRFELEVRHHFGRNEMRTNSWICKSHFNNDQFTASGKLKKHALPIDYTPKIVRSCMLCGAKETNTSLIKVAKNKWQLKRWKDLVGIEHDDLNVSTWICQSHFNSSQVTSNGRLRISTVPDGFFSKTTTRSCVYCELEKNTEDLVQIGVNKVQWERWKKKVGIESDDVIRNPWICKSHFNENDFTVTGRLKLSANPSSEKILRRNESDFDQRNYKEHRYEIDGDDTELDDFVDSSKTESSEYNNSMADDFTLEDECMTDPEQEMDLLEDTLRVRPDEEDISQFVCNASVFHDHTYARRKV